MGALKKLTIALLLLTGCAGGTPRRAPSDQPSGQPVPPAPPGVEGPRVPPGVALRLPADGGPVRAYPLPHLTPVEWVSSGAAGPVREPLAMDAAGNRMLYRTRAGEIAAFDLVAARERVITPRGRWLAALTTDTLLAVSDDGAVIESEPWGAQPWPTPLGGGVRDAFAGMGSHLVLVRRDSVTLATREAGATLTVPAPDATVLAASRSGDALAYGTDSGLVVLEERDQWRAWFVRLTGSPTAVAFTPSGHEVYVALREKSELAIVDRFTRRERPSVPLPGPAAQLRMDPWGRAVLVRALAASSRGETWVIGIASGRMLGRLSTPWGADLPAVSEDGTLLYRSGTSVVACDVRTLDSLGAVPDGASDFWFVTRWRPAAGVAAAQAAARRADSAATPTPATVATPAPAPAATPAPATPAPAARTRTPTAPAARPRAPTPVPATVAKAPPARGTTSWIQLGDFADEARARDFAGQLAGEGHRAQVAAPAAGGGWRVLLGPYPSRPAADSAARLLGRPYFITGRGPAGAAGP